MDDYCDVTFEGDQGGTYYVACNLVEYINGSDLSNTGSNSINLYTSLQAGNNSAYISIPAFSYPRYLSGNQYRYITNAHNIRFNNKASFIRDFDIVEVVLITLLASISLIRIIARGR